MEPKYKIGDRVDHKSVPCKKNGEILAVIWRTIYTIYQVRWCACTGDYFESELVLVEQEVKHE